MHIIIAPNAFKGSLSATESAVCIAAGLQESKLQCRLTKFPIGDGGDGTAVLIAEKLNASTIQVTVHDPIGKTITADFGWLEESKTAIIEMSEASGLRLLEKNELNPVKANTKGTGELIKAALDKGATKIVLGVGGSATVDGASGLLMELGVRFFDEDREEIKDVPEGLIGLKSIDISGLDPRLENCEIIVLCDVKNKLLGTNGATAIFGPQKGADKTQVDLLEGCLAQLNKITREDLNVDMSAIIHGGAAGGLAAGLCAFLKADLVSGIDYFLKIMDFEEALKGADLVITGEGSLDEQTLEGKGPTGVAKQAKEKNIPVLMLAGAIPLQPGKEMHEYFDAILPIGHAVVSLEEAMNNTAADLTRTACEIGNILSIRKK